MLPISPRSINVDALGGGSCPKASCMIVPPNPRLAGNNKRTPKLMAAIAALHLSPKKANCSAIVVTIVESLILIYTLLGSTSHCIYLSMLIDKEVCQNPEIENQTARFVEQKFDVNVD